MIESQALFLRRKKPTPRQPVISSGATLGGSEAQREKQPETDVNSQRKFGILISLENFKVGGRRKRNGDNRERNAHGESKEKLWEL
ncbi:unnamed protein product [Pleuronectes platessa]|uniref:Uncharacterized protein n=1 Tax=Pleuronectes platessa TaxID=8262 RepID=A0A9N7YPX5_PLEPL|nr:unnamed protein product [Pleuronectes platessa]